MQALIGLGFTGLEAEIYDFLLDEPPATGYRVAQALSKPPGVTYKAIESLESKGALLADTSDRKLYRAVDAEELLEQLDRRHRRQSDNARRALVRQRSPRVDDGLYQLHSADQVYVRAAAILTQSREFVVASICPAPMKTLRDQLADTAARGVAVGVKTFESVKLPGAKLVPDPRGKEAVDGGPGQWFTLNADGRETLLALFDHEGQTLHQGLWTQSPFVSWILFTGIASNLELIAVVNALDAGDSAARVLAQLRSFEPFDNPRSAGKEILSQRYRAPGKRGRRKGT